MGTARIPTHGSCLPLISKSTSLPCSSIDLVGLLILEVGLIIKSILILYQFDIHPRIPPELLDEKPFELISSRSSEPLNLAIFRLLPIETDLTAFMLIIALAKSASNLSNTGSPKPGGQFFTNTVNLAPIESP